MTEKCLPILQDGAQIINISSGAGTRQTTLLSEAARVELETAADATAIRSVIRRLAQEAAAKPVQKDETPIYALSKAGVNFYTRLVARSVPRLRVNACSPGFCRTEIAGPGAVYASREPKSAQLGADVVLKLLAGELGPECTDTFFKECSTPNTPLSEAHSAAEPWAS